MHYIKDLFKNKETEHAHNKFIRYSKGEFTGPLIKIKMQKANIKFNASFHLANELLMLLADHLGNKEVDIKGNLSWNKDLSPELADVGIMYLKVTKSRGIFNYKLENKVKFKKFVDILGKYHLLVSLKMDDLKLTTKNKLPKPNKEISADFLKSVFPLSLKDKILSEFVFDHKNCEAKNIIIKHKIIVDNIDVPEAETFDEARRLAKREGTLIREVSLDGAEPIVSEVKFKI